VSDFSKDLEEDAQIYFNTKYNVTDGTAIPDVDDIALGPTGRQLDLAMLFIDIHESTAIVDAFRRTTAARMYKSFLAGITRIACHNDGELRSFNGDGVLVAFIGNSKRTNAAKAALRMSWFCRKILRSKLQTYFENNSQLQDITFNFGIGVACGTVLVVRGGIRGENNNDLVWVGNATNYAVKLSSLGSDPNHLWITEDVYKQMHESSRLGGEPRQDMWEKRIWKEMSDEVVYCSHWTWTP
jgi:class 3 adenylate cyclase